MNMSVEKPNWVLEIEQKNRERSKKMQVKMNLVGVGNCYIVYPKTSDPSLEGTDDNDDDSSLVKV